MSTPEPAARTPDGDARDERPHAVGWRSLAAATTLEVDADGTVLSVRSNAAPAPCDHGSPLAPLARWEGRALVDALRASDRVAWLHALDAARRGTPRSLRLTLCPTMDGRGWVDAAVRLAPPDAPPDAPPTAAPDAASDAASGAAADGVVLVALDVAAEPVAPAGPRLTELAHELRTPLNAVRGYAQALEAGLFGELGPRQGEAVQGIADASEHLIEIANAVLDGARLEAGDELTLAEGDPAGAVARACAMLAGPAERAGVTIALRPAPALRARHDAAALRQIVVNLVSNAVKASPRGAVVGVDLRAAGGPSGAAVEIAVRDAGAGIPDEMAGGTGAAWHRGIAAEGEATGGVGLPLVRRLCAQHGGCLRFERREGGGTIALVTLPAGGADRTVAETSDAPPSVAGDRAQAGHPDRGAIERFEAAYPCRLVG